ncbi:hypothetical protein HPP92_005143 [Vanilla planifolia]|uniref:Uncharacterized protein n=1 Tax=Vanilla planifolia TaxID=51239 RepID=A0A835RP37_VANPL|nr:hypothetical protein HPP92_005143 [Vanilla planifolia]
MNNDSSGQDDRGGVERSFGEEGWVKCNEDDTIGDLKKWQRKRDAIRKDPHTKVVYHLQGSHHSEGLRSTTAWVWSCITIRAE